MIDIIIETLTTCESTSQFIFTSIAVLLSVIAFSQLIQLFYNLITERHPYSQSPYWIGSLFRLLIKILMILVKLLSYIAMGAVWIYYKTRILLHIMTAKKTKVSSNTPPPYKPSKN